MIFMKPHNYPIPTMPNPRPTRVTLRSLATCHNMPAADRTQLVSLRELQQVTLHRRYYTHKANELV